MSYEDDLARKTYQTRVLRFVYLQPSNDVCPYPVKTKEGAYRGRAVYQAASCEKTNLSLLQLESI
jgi:hypothetical protein